MPSSCVLEPDVPGGMLRNGQRPLYDRPVTRETMPPELRAELDERFRATPLYAELGIEVLEWGPGHARMGLTTVPAHANLAGTVHGGVVFSLADAAFEVSCNGYGRLCVALDHVTHFTSGAVVGERLVAEAVEVSRSRRVASYRIEVTGEGGALRAWTMAVSHRTGRWHLGEQRWPADWREAH
jgi:acyl-CoA thioesterase